MRLRKFFCNIEGISVMYDAVLFIVMVSLSGVLLLPALRTPIATESSLDKNREQIVDEALHTYLVTRADFFDYKFSGNIIDDVAGHIGIDNTSDGLYGSLTQWLLGHEQCHKTYATLLAENLGCQFQVPFSFLGTNQLNIFVGNFERELKNDTECFFSTLVDEKYGYNLTAWWHPIKGVSFGGSFYAGSQIPPKDTYVAHSIMMMPFIPCIKFGNHTIVFTKHWLKHQLFSEDIGFGRSTIPEIANMTIIFENYTNGYPPFDSKETAARATKENLSALVYGFLISGIVNECNVTVFPGIVNMSLSYGFQKLRNVTTYGLNKTLNELFGESIRSVDQVFFGLNNSNTNPLSQSMLMQLTIALNKLLNGSFGSLDDVLDACESKIRQQISDLLRGVLDPLIDGFVNGIFECIETIKDFAEMLVDWFFDRISLDKAEVVLTIWVVRE